MAQMKNLQENDVSDLKKLFNETIKPRNEDATLKILPEGQAEFAIEMRFKMIYDSLANITAILRHIFDGHVLIDGRFVKINPNGIEQCQSQTK
jgi:hypothetical protein